MGSSMPYQGSCGHLMWADNETTVDLLGYDYLVDSLLVVLTEPRLLPVTVGLAGDWGSGKTSLMSMAAAALRSEDPRFVTVSFSPWRFEDYEDVKGALMTAVIDALQARVDSEPSLSERVGERLRGLRERVWQMGLARGAATGGALLVGADPALATIAGEAAQGIAEPPATAGTTDRRYHNVARFRSDFSGLMRDLGGEVRALVVFIDDLDRCLTDAVVETFEAIRLFLHVEGTAYVIGADQRLVQAAIEARYPAAAETGESLGRNYLEKILQVTVAIPPLSEPEVETFIGLLLAELELDSEQYGRLLAAAQQSRHGGQLAVAMNEGIARAALGQLPESLGRAFALTRQISPTLARGLRGNPRQLKRFLNTFILRTRTAQRRGVQLDGAILAKLMVLEELAFPRFEQLFTWQLQQEGRPSQLATAEAAVRSAERVENLQEDARAWTEEPRAHEWLSLEPPLAEHDLGAYFFFSRDRLSPAAPAARLAPAMQELLGRLCSDVKSRRLSAINEFKQLQGEDPRAVYGALIERASADPGAAAMESALEIASGVSELIPVFTGALRILPLKSIPPALPLKLRVQLAQKTDLTALFSHWRTGPKALQTAVAKAEGD